MPRSLVEECGENSLPSCVRHVTVVQVWIVRISAIAPAGAGEPARTVAADISEVPGEVIADVELQSLRQPLISGYCYGLIVAHSAVVVVVDRRPDRVRAIQLGLCITYGVGLYLGQVVEMR